MKRQRKRIKSLFRHRVRRASNDRRPREDRIQEGDTTCTTGAEMWEESGRDGDGAEEVGVELGDVRFSPRSVIYISISALLYIFNLTLPSSFSSSDVFNLHTFF